jgi:FkbM family methyltransferase
MKKLINFLLLPLGLEVRRRKPPRLVHNEQMFAALERFSVLNQKVFTIIDVGAARGEWSIDAKQLWPNAAFLLFEPLDEQRLQLERLAQSYKNFHIVNAAAGKTKGKEKFYVADDLDGSGVASNAEGLRTRDVAVTTIQDEVERLDLDGPYIIKLDTHGYELPILQGCTKLLPNVSLFIIECYGFQVAKDSLLFWEMCKHMDSLGFRVFDLVDVMRRPVDNCFWQADIFFIRKDHGLFQRKDFN